MQFRTEPRAGKEAGSGSVTVEYKAPAAGFAYLIDRISVYSNSSTTTACTIYCGNASPENVVDYTPAGNYDIADENSPIYIPAGSKVSVVWTGVSSTADCYVRLQYRIVTETKGVA